MMYRIMMTASALACSAALNLALAQGTMTGAPGNWTVHTAAKGGCPGIALQVQRVGNDLNSYSPPGNQDAAARHGIVSLTAQPCVDDEAAGDQIQSYIIT
jgi:hypothetical protein